MSPTGRSGDRVVDLVVIGFGPTGAALAGLCARRGLDVVVIERDTEVFPLPRAVQIDHEGLRVLQELGCADEVLSDSILNDGLAFVTADRRTLLSATVPPLAPTGWPSSVFFHQPTFESILRRTVLGMGVDVRLGAEVQGLDQDDQGVDVSLGGGGSLRARYVVGCDGARSMTRKAIGTALSDTGFEESWLVVDLLLAGDVPDLPTRCLQVCDPARPHTLVPMPAPRFRFEFMLLPGEAEEDVRRAEVIDDLMSVWIDPALAEVERSAVYTFHGLVASTWRDRRVLLAGDAAHQTPPFLGQGMCAGMRDAANLAWKLAGVLGGASPDGLLDTYQAEREPHAQLVIDAAVGFGQLICMTDPEASRRRDEAMLADFSGEATAPDFIPPLAGGPAIGPGGGRLSCQPRILGELLDDRVGPTFLLCTADRIDPDSRNARWWVDRAVVLDVASTPAIAELLDGSDACVVRPDRYVMIRGTVDEVTAFAASALGSALPV
ncbi:MAG TPA: bifunctional 3-(3-hydroxy-phenyl)propionate/3-hydroxycinnamic acid hydroxylase [Acidimicrobiales bacterium]